MLGRFEEGVSTIEYGTILNEPISRLSSLPYFVKIKVAFSLWETMEKTPLSIQTFN